MPEPQALLSAALLALVPSLVYLAILNAVDRYEKEPWTILLACVGLGAVAAPLISVIVLGLAGRTPAEALAPQLAPSPNGADTLVAVVQEVVKGVLLVILTHSARDEFDDVLDGVVYGAALGAGFGAAESFVYAIGGTAGLSGSTLVGLLVSGLGHAFYTGALGAILGAATRLHSARLATVVAVYGVATAALLHSLHDALPFMLARTIGVADAALGVGTRALAEAVNLLGILTLAVIVVGALRRESHVLRDQLREEVETGVLSDDDYRTIASFRGRTGREMATLRRGGIGRFRTLRRLYGTAGELAFHKWRLAVRKRRRPSPSRTDVLRAEIQRLRQSLDEVPS
jgi:RsiW-degrading membrane proteinase PrsW (M82 family)